MSARQRATSWGALAIALWSTLAAASVLVTAIPPLQLMAMTFGVASLLSLVKWTARRESIASHLRQPLGAWLVGCGGLFGYHLLVFLRFEWPRRPRPTSSTTCGRCSSSCSPRHCRVRRFARGTCSAQRFRSWAPRWS